MDMAATQAYVEAGETLVEDISSQVPDQLTDDTNKTEDDARPTCGKCQLPVSLENTVFKSLNQKNIVCKGCHAASVMMSRHFTSMPKAWQKLTDEEQVNFFRRVLSKKQGEDGPLRFKVLRTELKDVLVKKTVEEKKKGFNGEFLPLETYRLRGFNCDKIEKLAEKEEHPILGDTYRIDIKHISEDFIEQDIEESLTEVEKHVKRTHRPEHMQPKKKAKAAPKRKGKGRGKGQNEDIDDQDEEPKEEEIPPTQPDPVFVDLLDLESDSEVEVTC